MRIFYSLVLLDSGFVNNKHVNHVIKIHNLNSFKQNLQVILNATDINHFVAVMKCYKQSS